MDGVVDESERSGREEYRGEETHPKEKERQSSALSTISTCAVAGTEGWNRFYGFHEASTASFYLFFFF